MIDEMHILSDILKHDGKIIIYDKNIAIYHNDSESFYQRNGNNDIVNDIRRAIREFVDEQIHR